MLSLSKHLYRFVGVTTPSGAAEMIRQAQHDGLFDFFKYVLSLSLRLRRLSRCKQVVKHPYQSQPPS
jgi:hypothetical protein